MDDATMSGAALRVNDLYKSFGATSVLNKLCFAVEPGRTMAIIGRSGSGKSTLLRCLNMTLMPDMAKLTLGKQVYFEDGRLLFEPWEIRRHIGLVLQHYPLIPNLTVMDNLCLALRYNLNKNRDAAITIIEPIAARLGISTLYKHYPATLSGGQAQRCALARALVLHPQVLLLDEVTSALDPITINDVISAIRLIREAPGSETMTIILVTHLLEFAESFADHIAFMHEGTIWEQHPAQDFRRSAKKKETLEYLRAQSS